VYVEVGLAGAGAGAAAGRPLGTGAFFASTLHQLYRRNHVREDILEGRGA
jgi:hypothetical protein